MINRVERHIIIKNKEFDNLTFLSKNLYNYVNYILRQALSNKHDNIEEYKDLIIDNKYVSEYDLIKRLTKLKQLDYYSLPTQVSQQIIKLLYINWKSFYKSLKYYYKNKSKFKGKPKIPKYKNKNGKNILIFSNQQARLNKNYINFPKKTNIKPLKTKVNNVQQVRIIPKLGHYIVEVVYKKEKEINDNLNKDLYMSIDLGIDNLITTSNNAGLQSFIVNGKIVKSINQYYNKKKAKLNSYVGDKGTSNKLNKLELKRNNKITDYLHKTSRFIINYCIKNNIKNIVIGYNEGWKQNINIGKRNNQKFVSIPYLKLIQQIQYKSEEVGINVILHEESYTSKCDALSKEKIKFHKNYKGKRIKRGLFQSYINKLINADINGSLNILRKVIGDSFVKKITNIGLVCNPIRYNV